MAFHTTWLLCKIVWPKYPQSDHCSLMEKQIISRGCVLVKEPSLHNIFTPLENKNKLSQVLSHNLFINICNWQGSTFEKPAVTPLIVIASKSHCD